MEAHAGNCRQMLNQKTSSVSLKPKCIVVSLFPMKSSLLAPVAGVLCRMARRLCWFFFYLHMISDGWPPHLQFLTKRLNVTAAQRNLMQVSAQNELWTHFIFPILKLPCFRKRSSNYNYFWEEYTRLFWLSDFIIYSIIWDICQSII